VCRYFIGNTLTVILIKIYKSSTVKRVNVLISRAAASRVWQVGNLWGTKIYFREIYASARGNNLLFTYACRGVEFRSQRDRSVNMLKVFDQE